MRNLRFVHKEPEDSLKKSVFEVLMKFAFSLSNNMVRNINAQRMYINTAYIINDIPNLTDSAPD